MSAFPLAVFLPSRHLFVQVRVRKMIQDYIQHPSCIILAVSPANQDIVNSDALDMARQVDPEGHRTIGELPSLPVCLPAADLPPCLPACLFVGGTAWVGVLWWWGCC